MKKCQSQFLLWCPPTSFTCSYFDLNVILFARSQERKQSTASQEQHPLPVAPFSLPNPKISFREPRLRGRASAAGEQGQERPELPGAGAVRERCGPGPGAVRAVRNWDRDRDRVRAVRAVREREEEQERCETWCRWWPSCGRRRAAGHC